MNKYIIKNNDDVREFLNYLRKEYNCSMREFSKEFMDVGYDLGYSLLTGRRNSTMGTLFHILNRLGYNLMIVPENKIEEVDANEKTRETAITQNE